MKIALQRGTVLLISALNCHAYTAFGKTAQSGPDVGQVRGISTATIGAAMPTTKEKWRPGVDYSMLAPPAGTQVAAGKIEILECFLYSSPYSRDFQPYLQAWLARMPGAFEYRRVPAVTMPHARLQARMYFTLRTLKREDLHEKFFAWVGDHLDIYHGPLDSVMHPNEKAIFELSLEFARINGIDPQKFSEIYNSRSIEDEVIRAEMRGHEFHVVGASTVVVNGKYSTSIRRLVSSRDSVKPEDYARLLRLIQYLATKEAKEAAA